MSNQEIKEITTGLTKILESIEDLKTRVEALEKPKQLADGSSKDDLVVKFNPEVQCSEAHLKDIGISVNDPMVENNFHLFWDLPRKKVPKVAIVDTGVDVHQFLRDNIKGGVNFSNGASRTDWIDRNGHGTNVASIVKTVCPDVELYAVKIIGDDGRGSNDALVRGLDWCIYNQMDVINLSLGSQRHYEPLEYKVRDCLRAGIFIACAAGNDYRAGVANTVDYPGRYDEAVCTVAALTNGHKHAHFSSAGKEVDIAVRGVKVYGAIKAPNTWGYMSGTSQATPHIAGLAASMIRAFPNITPHEIIDLIKRTAIDIGEKGEDDVFGAGVVNPAGILESLKTLGVS